MLRRLYSHVWRLCSHVGRLYSHVGEAMRYVGEAMRYVVEAICVLFPIIIPSQPKSSSELFCAVGWVVAIKG
jgi:hypothetical protein